MVNGKVVVNNSKLCTGDEEKILAKAKEWEGKINS
jgi:hypothetical protein